MISEKYERQRVNNFTDAVFSIALTVLILDISAPLFKNPDAVTFSTIFQSRIAGFIGYMVSFFVIAMFWRSNVRNHRHVTEVDGKMMALTIWMLFFVVLLPFSTSLYVNNFVSNAAFQWYAINVALIGLFNSGLIKHIYKNKLHDGTMSRKHYRYYILRSRSVMVVWLFAALAAMVVPMYISRFMFLFIFVLDALINRYWKKRIFD
jgi:uncharacterized membrane protein